MAFHSSQSHCIHIQIERVKFCEQNASLWHHYDIITMTSLLWHHLWHCYYDIITMTSLYSITFHYVLIQFFIAYSMNKNGRGGWPVDKANQWVVRAIVNISTLFQTRSNEKQDLVTSLLGTRTKNEFLPSYNCTPSYSTQPSAWMKQLQLCTYPLVHEYHLHRQEVRYGIPYRLYRKQNYNKVTHTQKREQVWLVYNRMVGHFWNQSLTMASLLGL